MKLFVLDDTVNPVLFIVEEAFAGRRLEPLSAGHEPSEEATEDSDAQAYSETSELISGLNIGLS